MKPTSDKACTYQLHILVKKDLNLQIGKLGKFHFPAGQYVYTGSAKKNMQSRIKRHCSNDKKCRWHIDYLLINLHTEVTQINYSTLPECQLNQSTEGEIIIKRFGASDCIKQCISHLKHIKA